MGKKLTFYERAERQRERDNERSRNAAKRDSERRRRERDREQELQKRKKLNEADRLARKVAKDKELEDIRREGEKLVSSYQDFVSSLKSLHINKGVIRVAKAIGALAKPHPFDLASINKPTKPEEPRFSFSARVFSSKDQVEFDKLVDTLTFDFKQYATHIGKKQTTLYTQLVWLVTLAFGTVFLLWSYWNKSEIEVIIGAFNCLLFFRKLVIVSQIINGNDKRYASLRGYEIFIDKTKARLDELAAKISIQKDEFINAELKRESDARQQYQKKIQAFRIQEIPRFEMEIRDWERQINEASTIHLSNEEFRKKWFNSLVKGDTLVMTEACELLFPISYELDEDFLNSNPSEFDIGYQIVNENLIRLCVSLPSQYKFLPDYEIKMKPSGRESTKIINSEARQVEASAAVMSGTVLGLASLCFKVMPTVSNIEIELNGFKTELSTGEEKIELFIVMDLSREDFSRLKLDSIDPVEAVKKLSRAFKKSGSDKELESIIDRDEILWSTLDNEPVDINTYIRTLYTNRLILK
jgi:hypothetical protein